MIIYNLSPKTQQAIKILGITRNDVVTKTKKKIKEESIMTLKGMPFDD